MSADAEDTRNSSAIEPRVDDAIAAYLEAVDSGETVDISEFLARHGDIASELRAFFDDHEDFDRVARPLERAASSGQSCKSSAGHPSIRENGHPFPTNGRFGDYELGGEIARGGMGVVYKARQTTLNRIVAIKLILAGRLATHEEVQRFRAEAEAAANLDHPGIVPIYEVGQQDGQHYFSMGYVDGKSLAERLLEKPIPPREAAELLHQVCAAVQYAHDRGVIHRDLKPANILLEQDRPRITDFGLAKRLHGTPNLTTTGQIVGTAGYMSPEQATSGKSHRIGATSDIYSLGAILYEMLTGRPPFQGETPLNTLSQLLDSSPLPPRLLNPAVPQDLEAICLKCLEKEPARRYQTARDLGDELQRYRDGEPIQASGVNLLERLTRALGHNRHEEHFRGWGLGLMAFALVIFLSHVAIYLSEGVWRNPWLGYFIPRSTMFAALLMMLWIFRRHSIFPTNSAERLIWVVWIGYVLALGCSNLVRTVVGHDQGESYATCAVLAGFGFFVTGGHVWGGGYLVGLMFMLAAPALAAHTEFAPLGSGALWGMALLTFGVHYWRRGRIDQAKPDSRG